MTLKQVKEFSSHFHHDLYNFYVFYNVQLLFCAWLVSTSALFLLFFMVDKWKVNSFIGCGFQLF